MKKIKYLSILMLFIFVSCAGLQSYYYKLEKYILKDDYAEAQNLIAESKKSYGDKNEFLYYLDLGFVEHVSGNYDKSGEAFEQAKKIYDKNYTKSVSAGVFSLFANDNVIPYYGHPYEITYVNVFCALNYILQGQRNEAVVEARQADNVFRKINADSFGKTFYNDDPFIRYFMGLVYENAGYYNDALISYKLALRGYDKSLKENKNIGYSLPVPKDLVYSLYDLYYNLGFSQEAADLKTKFSSLFTDLPEHDKNCGELVVVNYNGLSPRKIDSTIELAFSKAWAYFDAESISSQEQDQVKKVKSAVISGFSSDYIKISFPKYERFDNKIKSFIVEGIDDNKKEVSLTGGDSYAAGDPGTLMISALKRENLAIYSKTIARAVGRYVIAKVAADQVRQQAGDNGDVLGFLTNSVLNVTNSLLEKADKRSWRTLPETINLAKIYLPEGTHNLNIKYLSASKSVVESEKLTVEIKRNRKTFVITKSFKG